ncbi:unnamed protein product [Orchesella dallaii]|uniref:Transcription initiation factor TFIID subunit 8 n=1 Tax=Orchesella dallaii TaxID=48710 RepID=A0ABP1RRI1_9HEXA
MEFKVDPRGLETYLKRMTTPIISSPQTLPLPKVPTILSAGKKRPLPPHIPDYCPPIPDPHVCIRSSPPVHKQPITDYATCRKKTSRQKRDLWKSLSKFFERTLSCYYLHENESLSPLLLPKPATYLNPLIPQDQFYEEEQILAPLNYVKKEKPMEHVLNLDDDRDDDVLATTQFTATTSWEFIDNPFLKPTVLRMIS